MSGAKVAIIFGFPGVLVPCGHCFLSIFFPFGFRGRRFSVFPVPFGAVFSGSQAHRERHGATYSVYFVLRTCFALHTVYISCCRRVWRYIQCIFCVADVFGVTYSVYSVLQTCLALHTVYILCCGCVWYYIQCIFHLVGRFEGKNGRQRPENEVGGSIECRLKGVRRLFEAIVRVRGHFSTDGRPLSGLFAYIRAFEGKDRKPALLFHLKKYGRNERD